MKRKGFTLIEILVAVVIFGLIITIVINFFNSINTERKISTEKSKINQLVTIIEKDIRDYISSSNLYLYSNLIDNLNSDFSFIRPYYIPTAVIVPAIYETQSNYLLLFYNNIDNNESTYIRIRSVNNRVLFENSGIVQNNLRFITNQQGNKFFYYFRLSNPINNWIPNNTKTIEFSKSSFNNATYQVSLKFFRQVIARASQISQEMQDIIYQTHGNITNTNTNIIPNQIITNPNLLYSEIRIGLYQNNHRRLLYTKTMSFYIRHKSII